MIPGYFNIFQENICIYQGYFFAYSSLSGTIWVLAIAWSLNQALILNQHNIELYHKHWFISAMIVPAIISALPFLTNSYGLSSAWCTLKENDVGRIWKFFMFYLPSWIIILITVVIYIKIAIKMKKCDKYATETEKVKKIINRVVAYPVIMIITFLPITIVRLFSLFDNNVNFFLMCFAYFSYGIYGFANSIAYGYNDTVLDSIKESVLKRKINTSEFFLTPEPSHFK